MPSILERMAEASDLHKRFGYGYCPYGTYDGGDGYCYRSNWSTWGRWVLLAVILVVVFGIFLIVSCLNARRRRKRGIQPIAGTGWMAPAGHGPAQYTGNQSYPMNNQQQYQPPNYAPPTQGGANADYYGGQEAGVTQPAGVYQPNRGVGGENVYAPPEGPPPGKKY